MRLKSRGDGVWVKNGLSSWGLGIALFVIALIFSATLSVYGADKVKSGGKDKPEKAGEAHEFPNPHWRENYCGECHTGKPKKGKPLSFREGGDFLKLCNRCHEEVSAHAYIHATGMVPSEEKLARMNPDFKGALYRGDKDGRLTCVVCHNLVYQCLKEEFGRRRENPLFFRGGPYGGRTEICYKCHEPARYARMDPHDMINDEGEILTTKCVICHMVVPDVKKAKGIEDVTFKVEKDLEQLCRRCHFTMPLHPGTFIGDMQAGQRRGEEPFTHLRVPPEKILKRIEKTTAEKKIIIPLEPGTKKIFCATCHNPHERGIQLRPEADRGADNIQRLRADRRGEICTMCH